MDIHQSRFMLPVATASKLYASFAMLPAGGKVEQLQ